ncbi:MAG TPA: hypothetical protein VFP87_03705 [Chitinophagaceae bacterium]|nr:hypothetical protein [Chitinophagaceae bacterium]
MIIIVIMCSSDSMNAKWAMPLLYFALLCFSSCKKTADAFIGYGLKNPNTAQFVEYTIHQGQHYADPRSYQLVSYDELQFIVRFDSTAIYQTGDPENQEDINKLYGFSDNNSEHQQFSARFGWNWTRGTLRLYAYVYNNGVRSSQEITSIQIGAEHNCSIKVAGDHYIFSADSATVKMPRSSSSANGDGYKLYPYFGGDETAPHDIHVCIREL